MREILFRGKRATKTGVPGADWVKGYLVKTLNPYSGSIFEPLGDCDYPVIPETIGEYTGLTDKNGTKIFEGDIFLNKFHNEPTNVGIVRYGEYCNAFNSDPYCSHIGFYVDWNDDLKIMRKDLGFWCKRREVVGNIFDNPELLKGEIDNE